MDHGAIRIDLYHGLAAAMYSFMPTLLHYQVPRKYLFLSSYFMLQTAYFPLQLMARLVHAKHGGH